jgi:hypothetical protein
MRVRHMKRSIFSRVAEWWYARKNRKVCFHHDPGGNPANSRPAESFIHQELIDMGRRKLYSCNECGKVWII